MDLHACLDEESSSDVAALRLAVRRLREANEALKCEVGERDQAIQQMQLRLQSLPNLVRVPSVDVELGGAQTATSSAHATDHPEGPASKRAKVDASGNSDTAFDTEKYLEEQIGIIKQRLSEYQDGPTFIEFGGKPFGDEHAKRVLPGYQVNCKARLLKELSLLAKVVMVVNALDILPEPTGRYPRGRIRGDSQLRYGAETIRLIHEAKDLGIKVECVVLSITPRTLSVEETQLLDSFKNDLSLIGITLYRHYGVDNYPDVSILTEDIEESFNKNDIVADPNRHLVIFSPGGGSGKFGVALSEIYHALKSKSCVPNFLKFETFPVFKLTSTHPLNMAFESATADLKNEVICVGEDATSYDKDVENFVLLKTMYDIMDVPSALKNRIVGYKNPTDMGVNLLHKGIVDQGLVTKACGIEILRRYNRYIAEWLKGDERETTVRRSYLILRKFMLLHQGTVDFKEVDDEPSLRRQVSLHRTNSSLQISL